MANANLDTLVPAWFACRLTGVPKQTFHSWVASGKLRPVHGHGRHARYRYRDVLQVERQTRRHPKSHRARLNPPPSQSAPNPPGEPPDFQR